MGRDGLRGGRRRRSVAVLAALMLLAFFAVPSQAKLVMETVGKTEYTVRGRTPREVYESMHRYATRLEGDIALAMCETTMSYRLQYQGRGNRFYLAKHTVLLQYRYYYPKWVSRSYAPQELRDTWDSVMAILTHHEQMHAAIHLRHARALDAALGKLPVYGSERALLSAAEELFDLYKQRSIDENNKWDRDSTDAEAIYKLFRECEARLSGRQ